MKYFLKYLRMPNSSELDDVWQYSLLMILALIPSIVAYVIFWFLYSKEIHLGEAESQLAKYFTFTLLSFIYGAQAGRTIMKADTGYDEILAAVSEVDQDKFNKVYHKRINRWNHLFLGMVAFFMIGLLMLMEFASFYQGAIIITSMTYIMAILLLFAVSLDHSGEISIFSKYIPRVFIENFEEYQKAMETKLKELIEERKKKLAEKNT